MSGTLSGILGFVLLVSAMTLWFRAAMGVRLPVNRGWYVASVAIAFALAASALAQGPNLAGTVLAGFTILGALFYLVLVAISGQQVAANAITVGEKLRAFTAVDENGEPFSSANLSGNPVLLKFFRGHW